MKQYYSDRANEYEEIYKRPDPIRQKELAAITARIQKLFPAKNVLEIACGTGFWTAKIVDVANHVTAVDYSREVLDVALSKEMPTDKISFIKDDAYRLSKVNGVFNAGLANLWFSHVPKERIAEFLKKFHSKLAPGSPVFMADNVLIPGLGGDLLRKPGDENTYKIRMLNSGEKFEVLKNYYSADELKSLFQKYGKNIKVTVEKCFWTVEYNL